jgi:hypothetical protein
MVATFTDNPDFLPDDFDFDALPAVVQRAICELVQPAYDELVAGADGALERAAGASFTFLLLLEVLDQFNLTDQLGKGLKQGRGCRSLQDEEVFRHLRLAGAKDKVGGFLLRLRAFRAKYG